MTKNQARLIDIVLYSGLVGALFILMRDNPDRQGLLIALIGIYIIIQYFRYSRWRLPFQRPAAIILLTLQFLIALAVQAIDGTFLPQILFFILIAELAYRTDKRWSLPFMLLSYFGYIFAVAYHFQFPPFPEIGYVIPRFIEYLLFWGFSFIASYAVQQKEQLAEANKELEQAAQELEKRTLLQERMRLSKEIHDVIGHTLTTALFGIESAKHVIKKGNVSQGVEQLEKSTYQIKQSLGDVRSIVHTLSDKDNLIDFKGSLLQLMKESEIQSGITITYEIADPLPKLSPQQELAIYRSLQEGITNGIRHGKSSRFHYLLKLEKSGLNILLEDEGDFQEDITYGFGLNGMVNRLQLLGGSLNLFRNQHGGCSVEIFLPLQQREGQSVEEGA